MGKKKSKTIRSNVSLKIGGKPLDIEFESPKRPVSLSRMLPVFQEVTNQLVNIGVERAVESGDEISCKAGCGACCRQPVPIGKSEAFAIADLVSSMPTEKREKVKERFSDAYEKLNKINWFKRLAELEQGDTDERRNLSMEYFSQGIACPFLIEESCSIHPDRPLSCREYLVTSPAENCSEPTESTVETVEMPATPSRLVREISKDTVSGQKNYLPLVAALEFAETNQETGRKLNGQEWVRSFFQAMMDDQKSRQKGS